MCRGDTVRGNALWFDKSYLLQWSLLRLEPDLRQWSMHGRHLCFWQSTVFRSSEPMLPAQFYLLYLRPVL